MPGDVHIICGIDPGLHTTGYGVLKVDEDDDSISVVEAGVLRCTARESLPIRLAELAAGLEDILDEHNIRHIAVEQVYSHYQRPRTAILMAHARGVFLCEAARRSIPVINVPSTTVKKHLTGNGRASKEQVQRAVTQLLSLDRLPQPHDVADALAIALAATSIFLKQQASAAEQPSGSVLPQRGSA